MLGDRFIYMEGPKTVIVWHWGLSHFTPSHHAGVDSEEILFFQQKLGPTNEPIPSWMASLGPFIATPLGTSHVSSLVKVHSTSVKWQDNPGNECGLPCHSWGMVAKYLLPQRQPLERYKRKNGPHHAGYWTPTIPPTSIGFWLCFGRMVDAPKKQTRWTKAYNIFREIIGSKVSDQKKLKPNSSSQLQLCSPKAGPRKIWHFWVIIFLIFSLHGRFLHFFQKDRCSWTKPGTHTKKGGINKHQQTWGNVKKIEKCPYCGHI